MHRGLFGCFSFKPHDGWWKDDDAKVIQLVGKAAMPMLDGCNAKESESMPMLDGCNAKESESFDWNLQSISNQNNRHLNLPIAIS